MLIKIYRIVNNKTDECYIGGTRQPLNKRWNEHMSHYRKGDKACSSRHLLSKYGPENCSIVLITEVEVPSLEYQRRIEREYYELYNGINSRRPYRSPDELKMDRKMHDAKNNAIKAEMITCECGLSFTKGNIRRHSKTKLHASLMRSNSKDVGQETETQRPNPVALSV